MKTMDVKPYFPLFQRISEESLQVLLPLFNLIRLEKNQKLYAQNEVSSGAGYLIIHGFVQLKDRQSNKNIGNLKVGDSLGEETLSSEPMLRSKVRLETATAESSTFLFELELENYLKLQSTLKSKGRDIDVFTIANYFKNNQI